jgi:uroporphyrinogen-III synthase
MEPVSINHAITGRTILIAPSGEHDLSAELARHGARVLVWPHVAIVEPDNYSTLDEAIQNLFGYDWLIFANTNAAGFFLGRLQNLSHEISVLDPLRVCAVDDATRQQLEESHVHVDLVPETLATDGVMAALETYNGGRDSLRGLNFLLPRAVISRDYLRQAIEDAGARVDFVAAYRTTSNNSELVQLSVLLDGGGIDCIAFTTPASVRSFSQLLDTNDLSRPLKEVVVACIDQSTSQAANELGVRPQITGTELTIPELARAIASYFSTNYARPV